MEQILPTLVALVVMAAFFLVAVTISMFILDRIGLIQFLFKHLRGPSGRHGYPGPMGMVGEPATLLNLIGAVPTLAHLDHVDHTHLDTYIIEGAYWAYIDRSRIYERHPDMVRSANKKFVVIGFVNGRSAENDHSIGDVYKPKAP